MIEVQNLSGGYGKQMIIKDLSFSVEKGEFLAILGPNGSGKSTLLKLLSGALPKSSGSIRLAGRDLLSYSPLEKARLMSVLAQEEYISFDFTVEEIVSLGRYPHQQGFIKRLKEKDHALIKEALELTKVSQYKQSLIHHLSGGEKQRVLLAKAIVQEPKILFLDEPTNHLDVQHTFHLLNLIKDWQKTKGTSILAILHDLNVASLYADRVLLLHEGRLKDLGDVQLLKNEEQLKEVYQVEVKSQAHPTIPKPQLFLTPQHGVLQLGAQADFTQQYTLTQNEQLIHVHFSRALRTISNGVFGEGLQWVQHFCNFHVDMNYHCANPKEDVAAWLDQLGLPKEQALGMMTAVQLEDRVVISRKVHGNSFLVIVTAGVGNAVDISHPREKMEAFQIGTINTMIFVDAHLSDGALVNAIISATEAKTKAMIDLQIMDKHSQTLATGTSTDSLSIASTQVGEVTPYAGSGTPLGKGIGELVYEATTLAIQNYLRKVANRG